MHIDTLILIFLINYLNTSVSNAILYACLSLINLFELKKFQKTQLTAQHSLLKLVSSNYPPQNAKLTPGVNNHCFTKKQFFKKNYTF